MARMALSCFFWASSSAETSSGRLGVGAAPVDGGCEGTKLAMTAGEGGTKGAAVPGGGGPPEGLRPAQRPRSPASR